MSGQVERDLLRAIDDAQARVKHYRIVLTMMVTAFLGALGLALAGGTIGVLSSQAHVDHGGPAFWLLMTGIPGVVTTFCFIVWWWELHHNIEGHYQGPPSRLVTQAKRAHEDHVMEAV